MTRRDPSARRGWRPSAIFAIAATLLVLDIALHPPGTPPEQILHAWPFYFAYVISFLTIGAAWLGHTRLTGEILVSESTVLAATGEGSTFTRRDPVALKGLPGEWAVYLVD